MKKWKIPLLILMTLALLAVFAALPVIAASVQDSATVNSSGFRQMQSLKLDFSQKKETLPMLAKLAMLGNMETIDIDPSQASMTEEEVFQAVESQLKDYEDAGIFQWFDVSVRGALPRLGIDLNNTNNFLVYWTVSYSSKDGDTRSLVVDIDDETGKILHISYYVYEPYSMDGVWERNQVVLDAFTDIYFSQIGLTDEAEYAESITSGFTYYERDGGVSCAVCYLADAVYGKVGLEFFAEGAGGFYLYFPK